MNLPDFLLTCPIEWGPDTDDCDRVSVEPSTTSEYILQPRDVLLVVEYHVNDAWNRTSYWEVTTVHNRRVEGMSLKMLYEDEHQQWKHGHRRFWLLKKVE